MNPTDELLFEVLDRPAAEWVEALDALCARHATEATELRRRFALLCDSGVTTAAAAATTATARHLDHDLPERFGPYRLLQRLGGGGMGVVYLARHEQLARQVALKLIRPERLYFENARERFRREIEAVARLAHPGCVQIHQVGDEQGVPYFAMEHIVGVGFDHLVDTLRARGNDAAALGKLNGADLIAVLRQHTADRVETASTELFKEAWVRTCLRLVLAAAEALAHAHGRGVVHRDVKPSNLMLTAAGRVVVIDFGLAVAEGTSRMTRSGAFLGSLPYMAPEQVRGDRDALDARSDVYALGVCLYELLTLRSPFESGSAEQTRQSILNGTVPPLRACNPAVDADVATMFARATELESERRYQTMHAFAADLAAALEHRPIAARPATAWRHGVRWARRHPAWATALALAACALLFVPLVVSIAVAGQRDLARAAEQLARRREYAAHVVAANAALSAGNGSEARRRLDACPQDLRGFEWRHLERGLDGALLTIAVQQEPLSAVAVSRDAAFLAAGSESGAVAVFAVNQSNARRDLRKAGSRIQALAFDAPAAALFVLDDDGVLCRFDRKSGALLHQRARGAPGERIALAPNASAIVCDLGAGRLVTLDPATLAPRREIALEGGTEWPLGAFVVGATADDLEVTANRVVGGLATWRLSDGRRVRMLDGPRLGNNLAAPPDRGDIASANASGDWWLAGSDVSALQHVSHGNHSIRCVGWTQGGAFALAGCSGGEVLVFEPRLRRLVRTLLGHRGQVTAIAGTQEHGLFATAGRDGSVRLWSALLSAQANAFFGVGFGAALAAHGEGGLFTGGLDAILRRIDLDCDAVAWQGQHPHWVNAMALVSGGTAVATSFHGTVRLWGVDHGEHLGDVEVSGVSHVRQMASDADGQRLALLDDRGHVAIVDVAARRVLGVAPICDMSRDSIAGGLAWDAQADVIFVAGRGALCEVEPDTLRVKQRHDLGQAAVSAMVLHGQTLYTAEWTSAPPGGRICRRARVGAGVLAQAPLSAAASALAMVDTRLAVARYDGRVGFFQPVDLEPILELQQPTQAVLNLVAPQSGDWLALQCENGDPLVLFARRDHGNASRARARAAQAAARDLATRALAATAWVPQARRELLARKDLEPALRDAAMANLPPVGAWSVATGAYDIAKSAEAGVVERPRLEVLRVCLREAVAASVDAHTTLARVSLGLVALRLGDADEALAAVAPIEPGTPDQMTIEGEGWNMPAVYFVRARAHAERSEGDQAAQAHAALRGLVEGAFAGDRQACAFSREVDDAAARTLRGK